MKKGLCGTIAYCVLATLLLPLLVTLLCGGLGNALPQEAQKLYGTADLAPFPSELEEYVVGVVAAEMPASFPEEALKAQAVAARTYQLRQMRAAGTDAVLYDVGQAYCTEAEQREKWGEQYPVYAAKIRAAVRETAGEILTYEGEPILAAFHAQSDGQTEDAVHVWHSAVPYLKSVESSGDRDAPDFETTVQIPAAEVAEKLGCAADAPIAVLERTAAGYVETVRVGDAEKSGREIREALGLRSTAFTVTREGDAFVFTTHGYGHGAGMSQYGAAARARAGKTYREILAHYYTGVSFEKIE